MPVSCRISAPVAAPAGCAEREVVGVGAGGDTVDVHRHRDQRLNEVWANGSSMCSYHRAEREPGDKGLFRESFSQEVEERDGVAESSARR